MSTDKLYALTDAQHATVLAALRFYQEEGMGDPARRSDAIHFIASNGNVVDPGLDAAGIDALCASINHDGLDFGDCVNLFGEDEDDPYVAAAKQQQRDGEVEIDLPAVVSRGADDGAYVMAWVWVSNEDAGITPDSDDAVAPGIAYALLVDTVFQGRVFAERDGDGKPIVYPTKQAAERELADHRAIQYRQVADGERALADVADDESVEPVTIQMNGDIVDAGGRVIGNVNQPLPY